MSPVILWGRRRYGFMLHPTANTLKVSRPLLSTINTKSVPCWPFPSCLLDVGFLGLSIFVFPHPDAEQTKQPQRTHCLRSSEGVHSESQQGSAFLPASGRIHSSSLRCSPPLSPLPLCVLQMLVTRPPLSCHSVTRDLISDTAWNALEIPVQMSFLLDISSRPSLTTLSKIPSTSFRLVRFMLIFVCFYPWRITSLSPVWVQSPVLLKNHIYNKFYFLKVGTSYLLLFSTWNSPRHIVDNQQIFVK